MGRRVFGLDDPHLDEPHPIRNHSLLANPIFTTAFIRSDARLDSPQITASLTKLQCSTV